MRVSRKVLAPGAWMFQTLYSAARSKRFIDRPASSEHRGAGNGTAALCSAAASPTLTRDRPKRSIGETFEAADRKETTRSLCVQEVVLRVDKKLCLRDAPPHPRHGVEAF